MALALDNSNHKNVTASTTTITLSSTNPVVVIVDLSTNGGPDIGVSSATYGALSFRGRAGAGANNIARYAILATSALSSEVFTINTTTSAFLTIDACGISGADMSSLAAAFDAASSVTSNADPLSLTTTNPITMAIASFRGNNASLGAGSGFTAVPLSNADFQIAETKILSTAQTLSCTINLAGNANGAIADAIVQAAAASQTPYNPWPQLGPTLAQRRSTGWTPKLVDWHRRQRPGRSRLWTPDRRIVLPPGFKKAA